MYKAAILKDAERWPPSLRAKLLPLLEIAEQFWLGDAATILETWKLSIGEVIHIPALVAEWKEYLRLPYPVCLFCMTMPRCEEREYAYLCAEHEGKLNFIALPHLDIMWIVGTRNMTFRDGRCLGLGLPVEETGIVLRAHAGSDGHIHGAGPLLATMAGIALLHCKNVRTVREGGADTAINRRRIAKGKKPLLSYHVLKMVTASSRAGGKRKQGTEQHVRIHLCRGHFKRYTEAAPLLGKHVGLYWWQPHVRGQDRSGVVLKDYDETTLI